MKPFENIMFLRVNDEFLALDSIAYLKVGNFLLQYTLKDGTEGDITYIDRESVLEQLQKFSLASTEDTEE